MKPTTESLCEAAEASAGTTPYISRADPISDVAALAAQLAEVREAWERYLAAADRPTDDPNAFRLCVQARRAMDTALSTSPSAALASVRAAALREAAERLDHGDVYVAAGCGWPVETNGHIAAWLRTEAERIEREAGR